MTAKNKKGAPVGGRVHWLIMFLSKEFKQAYKLRFDYEYHNYHFTRYEKQTPKDQFIIVRTSRNCFRCTYFNYENTYFEYFSERTAHDLAEHILALFEKVKRSERQGEYT